MSEQKRFCVNCGKKLEEGAIFCPYCGQKDDYYPADMFEDDFEEPYAKKSGFRLLKWIIGIIIVFAVIIIGAIVWVRSSSEKNDSAVAAEESVNESTGTAAEEQFKDGNEPNDTQDTATVLTDGTPLTGYLESKEDVDYFVIASSEEGKATLRLQHTPDNEKDGVGWRLSYADNGKTSTKLCWLSEEQTEVEITLAAGDNYVYISADSGISSEALKRVRETPYYISVEPEEEEEEEKEPEQTVNTGYIIPGSDSRYLTASDLSGLSSSELRLARNEIYARHGRRFDDSGLQSYFDSMSWYNGTISPGAFNEGMLNEYEKANVEFIRGFE